MTQKPVWQIEIVGERIALQFPYDPRVVSSLKAIMPTPRRWNPELKAWLLPRMWEVCTASRQLADRFGADLKIGPLLTVWAKAEKQRRQAIPDVMAESAELQQIPVAAERLHEAMLNRPFQTTGAAFLAHNRAGLLADDPGLGKTLQSIGAVIEANIIGPVLVVAPKSAVYDTWPRELALWAPGDYVTVIGPHLKPAERKAAMAKVLDLDADETYIGRHWVIVGPNYLRCKAETDQYGKYVYDPETRKPVKKPVREAIPEMFDVEWSAVIVDEAHRYLAGATGNVKKQSAQRQGLGLLNLREGGLRIALSGTPFRGKQHYAWGVLNWLRPDLYRAYWDWTKRHFDVFNDGFGMVIGRLKSKEAFYDELKNVMIRRTKGEVAQDLPPKMYGGTPLDPTKPDSPVAVWLDMSPQQSKVYAQMAKEALAELEGGDITANGILAIMTRLKQFACSTASLVGEEVTPAAPSNKLDWLIEFLAERGIDAEMIPGEAPKVVVASQFRRLLDMFAEELEAIGIKCWKYTGATSEKNRSFIVADWQHNPDSEFRVLLLTTAAGGVSLTLDAADELVLLDETFNPDDTTQVEDRIHRLSRMHNVSIWKLKSTNSIEESIAVTLAERDKGIRDVIDGERGVETARQLIGA